MKKEGAAEQQDQAPREETTLDLYDDDTKKLEESSSGDVPSMTKQEQTTKHQGGDDLYDEIMYEEEKLDGQGVWLQKDDGVFESEMKDDDNAHRSTNAMELRQGDAVSGKPSGKETWQEDLDRYRPLKSDESLKSLYVGNLTWWTADSDLEELVKEAGISKDLLSLLFFENKTNGKSRGYAALEFNTHLAAYTLKKLLDYRQIHGRTVISNLVTRENVEHYIRSGLKEQQQQQQPTPTFNRPKSNPSSSRPFHRGRRSEPIPHTDPSSLHHAHQKHEDYSGRRDQGPPLPSPSHHLTKSSSMPSKVVVLASSSSSSSRRHDGTPTAGSSSARDSSLSRDQPPSRNDDEPPSYQRPEISKFRESHSRARRVSERERSPHREERLPIIERYRETRILEPPGKGAASFDPSSSSEQRRPPPTFDRSHDRNASKSGRRQHHRRELR